MIAAEASSDDDDDDVVDFDLSKITEKYNNPAPPPVVDNSMYEDDESKELEPQVCTLLKLVYKMHFNLVKHQG